MDKPLFAIGVDDFALRNEWAKLPTGVTSGKLGAQVDLRVLDLLEQFGLRATVFVSGSTAQRFPTLLKEVVKRGHEVAGHGRMHEDLRLLHSSERVRDAVSSTLSILEESTGANVNGWKNPGLLQDRLVREGLACTEVEWCTGTMIPLVTAELGCGLSPFEDYDGRVELPTAPELDDYRHYVERGISPGSLERTWSRLAARFSSSILIFTIHPWLHLLEEDRYVALGRILEHLASARACKLEGEVCQMFRDGRINTGRMHQYALKLASRISENARNRITAKPAA